MAFNNSYTGGDPEMFSEWGQMSKFHVKFVGPRGKSRGIPLENLLLTLLEIVSDSIKLMR
jgi:hypothetical protein